MNLRGKLNKLFRLEEINGDGLCPTYLYRWTFLRFRSFAVYLHHFVGNDWASDMHDHPKRFISIGLFGKYLEETPKGQKVYRAPFIRTFPATHIHRLQMIDKGTCWTLVIVLRPVRQWGFWKDRKFIHWRKYVSENGASRKSC